eukprot:3496007-Pleurochrysis_carterae.AAC.3
MITYEDLDRGIERSSAIGVAASRLAGIGASSPECAREKSVVGAMGMVGVWNNGVASPAWAAALAFDTLDLLLWSRPSWISTARTCRIHLVVVEVAGTLRAPLVVWQLVGRTAPTAAYHSACPCNARALPLQPLACSSC